MTVLQKALTAVVVSGLAVDAYVHLSLAGQYSGAAAPLSQGALFRVEAGMAILAAVLLLVRPRRLTAAAAALVAGGGVAALLLYYFVDVGAIGPLPNMYEPIWSVPKAVTLIAQAIATAAAVALVAVLPRTRTTSAEQAAGNLPVQAHESR